MVMDNKKLIIIGLGETAQIAYEYFTHDSKYDVVAFSAHSQYITAERFLGIPVTTIENIKEVYPPEEYEVFVALSSGKLNRHRTSVYLEAKDKGYTCASYVSSKSFVWRDVKIGENVFIFENNTLQPFVEVGDNVVIWSGNHIGHNTRIEDHCFISSHCVISGFCSIGRSSFLGVNCTIENNTKIEKDNFIGAGALIRKDTTEKAFYQIKETEMSRIDSFRLFKIKG